MKTATRSSPTSRPSRPLSRNSKRKGRTPGSTRTCRCSSPKERPAPKCGGKKFRKETDILDVWFDSGVSWAAVLEPNPELDYPAQMYLEGSDQHRGWFHSGLLTSVGVRNQAPYHSVLTHGFVVDGEGKKQSKSKGNVTAPDELVKKYGAEILRLWVSACDYRDDLRISDEILQRLSEAYRRIRNTARFILGNLGDFDPDTQSVPYEQLRDIDRFTLHKMQRVIERVAKAYDEYSFHTVFHTLHQFCSVDLSSLYLDILKDTLYIQAPGDTARRSAQTVIFKILRDITQLMAPIMSFTAEEIWRHIPDWEGKEHSVHMSGFPKPDSSLTDDELADRWERIVEIRHEVTKALEIARKAKTIGLSLDASVTLYPPEKQAKFYERNAPDFEDTFIVSEAAVGSGEAPGDAFESEEIPGLKIAVRPAEGVKCPRCWKIKVPPDGRPEHPNVCERCIEVLDRLNG